MALFTPREIARDFIYMSFARTMSLLISFLRSLVIPGLLGPLSYGIWKSLSMIQTYAQFGDLGARAALRREIPFYAGKGDIARMSASRDVAFLVNNLSILIAAAATVAAALLIEDSAVSRAMFYFLPLLYTAHINSFMEQLLYSRKEFSWMSRLNMWAGVLEAVLAISMTWVLGLPGLILGTATSYVIATWMQLLHIRFDLHLRWNWSVFKELVSVGFPSHLNGLLYNIFLWVDRWLILSFLGLTSFGYYAFGMTINEYLFQFSYQLGNIISPRLVERYSERESIQDLRQMVEVPLIIISRVAPAVLGTVYFASELVVHVMLPKFEPGLLSLQILLVGTFFSSVPRGLSSFFITLRKQTQTVALYVAAIGMNTALVWWLISSGRGLPGAAAGTTTSLAFFGFGLVVMALRYFMGARDIARFMIRLVWPLPLGLALVWMAHFAGRAVQGPGGSLPRALAGPLVAALIFLLAYSPVLWSLYRSYGSRLAASDGGKES